MPGTHPEAVSRTVDSLAEVTDAGSTATRKHTQHNYSLVTAALDDFPPDKTYSTSIA